MNQTMMKQLELLSSLLPKPFDYTLDTEIPDEPGEEEVDLFEIVEYDPEPDLEEALNDFSE